VHRYVVRIRLPDRPGALGQVASRIGAVGGDIVAIDIIERSRGRAIDEFVLEMDGDHLVELLRNEIHEVDGVQVEDVRRVEPAPGAVED
jgi:ACT domain-containing protein